MCVGIHKPSFPKGNIYWSMIIYNQKKERGEQMQEEEIIIELDTPTPTKQAFHNLSLQMFNDIIYHDVLMKNHIASKEQIYSFKELGTQTGYRLNRVNDMKTYFLKSEDLDKLPLKVTKSERDSFRTDVLHVVTSIKTVKIPVNRDTSFRNIIEWVCNFKHSNNTHFLLWKIVGVVSAIDRINYRVMTEAGFGKDSIVDAIIDLINETANIYGATYAKLEYHLLNSFLFFNELANLKKEDLVNFQNFFLATGDFKNKYSKRSRKTLNTKELYNISNTSIGIASNLNGYYLEKGQDSFVSMFTRAVNNRFLPLKFGGVLQHDFDISFNVENVVKKNATFYKKIISTLNWFRKNGRKLDPVDWGYHVVKDFGVSGTRYKRTFDVLKKYVSFYAETKEEYVKLVDELYKCYVRGVEDDNKYLELKRGEGSSIKVERINV